MSTLQSVYIEKGSANRPKEDRVIRSMELARALAWEKTTLERYLNRDGVQNPGHISRCHLRKQPFSSRIDEYLGEI